MPDDQAPVPTIEIRDLTRQFGVLVAVDRASFTCRHRRQSCENRRRRGDHRCRVGAFLDILTDYCLPREDARALHGIGQVLTMPIFFASNAIYPLSLMPDWLRLVSHLNPLTYQVDALRALMLVAGTSHYGISVDFGILIMTTVVLTAMAARMYARMGY